MSDGSWNPPADLSWHEKQQVLAQVFERFPRPVVVETGLYNGQGSSYQFIGRAQVVVFDISQAQCVQALEQGVDQAHAGDTRATFAAIQDLDGPAFFWLDSHAVTEALEEDDSPLLAELEMIQLWPHGRQSVVLIDDVRMMGRHGWPTLQQVLELCMASWPHVRVQDDIVHCYPLEGGDAMLDPTPIAEAEKGQLPEAAPLPGPAAARMAVRPSPQTTLLKGAIVKSLTDYLKTPGARSSEYLVTLLTVVWYILNAWQDWTSTANGVKLSLPALVYIVSRGLAKYETRPEPPTPPPPAAG